MQYVDIITHMAKFVDDEEFLFFALVCRKWRYVWGQRPTNTMALRPATSVSQLSYSFECGLGRNTAVCTTTIEMGRRDLLRCAMANDCPWSGDVIELAAEAGDLELLQWAGPGTLLGDQKRVHFLQKGGI